MPLFTSLLSPDSPGRVSCPDRSRLASHEKRSGATDSLPVDSPVGTLRAGDSWLGEAPAEPHAHPN